MPFLAVSESVSVHNVNRFRYREGKGHRYNNKISGLFNTQCSIPDLTDEGSSASEDSDSEAESDSSISDSDSDLESSEDGEEKRIRAYVTSIFNEKNKQRAVETIQSTQEEDVITLPDETLP
jgi:hypothetical protein